MADTNRMPGSQGQTFGQTGEELAGDAKRRMQEAASSVTQKAQEVVSNLGQRAQGVASQAGQKAQEAASAAAEGAESALAGAGKGMTGLAGTLRERGPHEGRLGSATGAVADQLQAGGAYLQEHSLQDMAGDIEAVVRRHPLPTLLACFGLGCFVGMMWSKR